MRLLSSRGAESLLRKIEQRQWILWSFAILVSLLLSAVLVSFIVPMLHERTEELDRMHLNLAVRGLVGLVLLFEIYTIYQQLQIFRIRHELVRREELFRLISENAAAMIAVVGTVIEAFSLSIKSLKPAIPSRLSPSPLNTSPMGCST